MTQPPYKQKLTVSALLTKTDTFANSVDPDETTISSGSTLFALRFKTVNPVCISENVEIQGWKCPFQKFWVKCILNSIIRNHSIQWYCIILLHECSCATERSIQ